MSHTFARVREIVGDPRLVRAGRKLEVTPRALELKEPVSQLLAQAGALFDRSEGSIANIRRSFDTHSPDGVSVVFGAPLSLASQELMPVASTCFVSATDNDSSALREGRIYLDNGTFRNIDPEIQIAPLAKQRILDAVRAGHTLLKGKLTAKRYAAERDVAVAHSRAKAQW
ncbi:type 2 periplasmic-binding domain-containing protein [Noviherbaspirillum galbum]|uniref:Uncharacterized protein n=1 Tax=Noviherbaspirillum galbum TaxID=2709383 RepID=A0A6B3SNB0_9BURK|nr:hypothetical protein [Noviherbaspirillum galbum]NEX62211.1 hypothetical protein [Noviherbaspirillum galbum]